MKVKNTRQSESQKQKRLKAFEALRKSREKIISETKGRLPDPVITLRKLRRERDQQLVKDLHSK